jgi:hypothetical protein
MSSYHEVSTALQKGVEPALLCATCPWDRYCITPPSMTRAEIDAKMDEASKEDERRTAEAEAKGQKPGLPMGMLLTAITVGAADTQAQCCPVLANRLREQGGRTIVDGTKKLMQDWTD